MRLYNLGMGNGLYSITQCAILNLISLLSNLLMSLCVFDELSQVVPVDPLEPLSVSRVEEQPHCMSSLVVYALQNVSGSGSEHEADEREGVLDEVEHVHSGLVEEEVPVPWSALHEPTFVPARIISYYYVLLVSGQLVEDLVDEVSKASAVDFVLKDLYS